MKKNIGKKIMAIALTGTLSAALLMGCSSKDSQNNGSQNMDSGETQVIQFWYHDGNPTSNAIFEELIKRFETQNPGYQVDYVGLPSDSYLQKYNTAIATNTVPDVASIRDQDVSAMINQGALMCLEESFAGFAESEHISTNVLEAIRNCSIDHKLYCLPQYITPDIYWYNQELLTANNLEIPETIDEFMEICESYADAADGRYFYSLRGGAGSLDNMFDFIFTYADVYELFDEEGNCTLNAPEFVEALNAYASLYWNNWTSRDSVSNGFKEMVAEFGSGSSISIAHNSSSLAEHKTNLGEGNFVNSIAPANENGIVVTKDVPFMGYTIFESAKNKEGAMKFLEFLVSAEAASYLCEVEGRVPINDLVFDDEWYRSNQYMKVYQELTEAEHVKFLPRPLWLSQWNEFLSKVQEPDLQAVLLQEKSAEEVLKGWAEYLTNAQKEYLASNTGD